VRSESQNILSRRNTDLTHSEDEENMNESEFQTVRKKHRRKRAAEANSKRNWKRGQANRSPRHKSTSSVPPSERSADSDVESLHSLPAHGGHGSDSDCDNGSPQRGPPLSNEDFPSLPTPTKPDTSRSSKSVESSPPNLGSVNTSANDAPGPVNISPDSSTPPSPALSPAPAQAPVLVSPPPPPPPPTITPPVVTTAKTTSRSLTYRTENKSDSKPKTRSKSVGPNSRPPVTLLGAARRSQEAAPCSFKLEFGYELNMDLLTHNDKSAKPDSVEEKVEVEKPVTNQKPTEVRPKVESRKSNEESVKTTFVASNRTEGPRRGAPTNNTFQVYGPRIIQHHGMPNQPIVVMPTRVYHMPPNLPRRGPTIIAPYNAVRGQETKTVGTPCQVPGTMVRTPVPESSNVPQTVVNHNKEIKVDRPVILMPQAVKVISRTNAHGFIPPVNAIPLPKPSQTSAPPPASMPVAKTETSTSEFYIDFLKD